MIVSPDLYSASQTSGAMNCGLQQYDAGRHSVFSGLVEPHWISHRAPIHTILKQEPRDDDYPQYGKEEVGGGGFQHRLSPAGLGAGGVYGFPTPPRPDYHEPPSLGSPRDTTDYQQQPNSQRSQQGAESGGGGGGEAERVGGGSREGSPGAAGGSPPSPQAAAQPADEKPDHPDNSQSSNSENEFYENGDSLRRLQMALQRTGMMTEEKLQCPMCEFSCGVRSQFNEHLLSHETKCTACDFNADSNEKLREHMKKSHDGLCEEDGWAEEEPGLSTPKVNSQGKVKTFRCKQCEFSAVTKLEFWEHSRSHIKQERLLTCPKCPFVTEYKHHLEYHLRNHFGSKPFKCDKCPYTCVNKSMLNSHLKSHSNVYQFRCSDCTYATKYCHSLKLHLRKYGHSPAMVLNPDGSPNPLPIVDVYGTRRGPKQKGGKGCEKGPNLPMPLFNPYSLLPTQMPYYNLLNGIGPYAFGADAKADERNNNVEKVVEEAAGCEEAVDEERGAPLDLTLSYPTPGSPDPPANHSKSRRKGKAFKLDRLALRLREAGDEPDPKAMKVEPGAKSPEVKSCEADSEINNKQEEYNCTYCDISFKDVVMYTVHMGYHGYQDPFTCNMCGQQTPDKVAFFLHIGRISHM